MYHFFSAWMFINCILSLDFAVRFALSSEKKYIENRAVSVFCFGSALWSGSFAALFLLYRKDRLWRSVELKIARTKASMTNKRLSV